MCNSCGRIGGRESVVDSTSNRRPYHISTMTESNTHCSYLTGKDMLSCAALGEVYIPSICELEEYCKKTLHTMCPRYMKRGSEIRT